MAWLGEAGRGKVRRGEARQGKARPGMARRGMARQGRARQGVARHGVAGLGKARQGKARQGFWLFGFRVSNGETMTRFRKLYPAFWRDNRILLLDTREKLVAVYCLTGPQTNRIGLYVLSPGAAAEDCGLSDTVWHTVFRKVLDTVFWTYDSALRVLFIPTWWKWNKPDNVKAMMGALTDLGEVTQGPLHKAFAQNKQYLDTVYHTLLDSAYDTVCHTVSIQEQEQEQEQEQDKTTPLPPKGGKVRARSSVPDYDSDFLSFWQAYPKKMKKPIAWDAWTKAKGRPALPVILAAIAAQSQTAQWQKNSGQYIPYPATWLNGGCWDDEAKPPPDLLNQPPYKPPWEREPPNAALCVHRSGAT